MSVFDQFLLKDKAVLLTGGYGLLGRHFASVLSQMGASVAVSGRNLDKCREVAREVDGLAIEMDVSNRDSVENGVHAAEREFGGLDGLVNMASFSAPAQAGKSSNRDGFDVVAWERALQVDLTGTFHCCVAAGRGMREKGKGSIINMSSIYGVTAPDQGIYADIVNEDGSPFIKPPGYGVAKAGIANMTRYLATRWSAEGVRVNTLVLGGVFDGQDKGFVRRYEARTPMGRMASPEDCHGPLVFLLSDAASYMTGADLVIDGGWTIW
ncbi:short-chain dehydrogenase [Pseudodesulfovibrio nedwellii]|uniref:Short-chain dehydrogenase n=1 Tax=Pseudodesulfovibrio nedwellii TaxID=2973072 RepID=A0ABM8B2V3_9BACT|nr:SDR family oxidoreductase [Pseudodesulfovibrio nedwellii]BDQ38078.1 short-chain dehydrogenase [Pseudodesulfovibrio nedwellii]